MKIKVQFKAKDLERLFMEALMGRATSKFRDYDAADPFLKMFEELLEAVEEFEKWYNDREKYGPKCQELFDNIGAVFSFAETTQPMPKTVTRAVCCGMYMYKCLHDTYRNMEAALKAQMIVEAN